MTLMKIKSAIMKTSILNIYIFIFFLTSDFIAFAQPIDDDFGDLQEDDEPAVSINGKLMWLLLCGMLFAFYKYKRNIDNEKIEY